MGSAASITQKSDSNIKQPHKTNHHQETESLFKLEADSYIEQLSHGTKKYIALTHFFASIWFDYFSHEDNKCEYMHDDDSFNILDYILIRGGCCRNIIWNKRDINDIDTFINCHQLTKLHLHHLQKYHSSQDRQKSSKCILWRLYAQKFEDPMTAKEGRQDFVTDRIGYKISFSDYMLNTKFLIKILQNDERLQTKLGIYQYGRFASWNVTLTEDITYAGFNLKGCDLDFVDLRKSEIAEFSEKIQLSNQSMLLPNHIRYDAHCEAKSIDLPLYPSAYEESMRSADLTMNTLIIRWSDVLHSTDKNEIDFDWRPKIKNPTNDIDGIADALNYRVKTWGKDVTDVKYVLAQQKPKIHIWRVIKMYIKLQGKCVLDPTLINATIEMYPVWFTQQRLSADDEHCKKMAHFFVNLYSKTGAIDVRFECMELLKFNALCQSNMENVSEFKKYVLMEMENISDQTMKQEMERVMKKYKYNLNH